MMLYYPWQDENDLLAEHGKYVSVFGTWCSGCYGKQ